MTRGRDYTGPTWQQLSWYLRRIDRHHQLGHQERTEAAADARRRTCADAATRPGRDPYELGWEAIAKVRREHQVDEREPIPTAEPVDLDALVFGNPWLREYRGCFADAAAAATATAVRSALDLKNASRASGPEEASPSRGAT